MIRALVEAGANTSNAALQRMTQLNVTLWRSPLGVLKTRP
jgi:hypothetical protein